MNNGTTGWLHVSIVIDAPQQPPIDTSVPVNKTSVVVVSASFISLMVISLFWLIIYYIQRFRSVNTKDEMTKQLLSSIRKALTMIPLKIFKECEAEVECCAVCLEKYRRIDVLRILPCNHHFHKCCVDPWLLERRTCPMCKLDILKYFGYLREDEFHVESEVNQTNNQPHDSEQILASLQVLNPSVITTVTQPSTTTNNNEHTNSVCS